MCCRGCKTVYFAECPPSYINLSNWEGGRGASLGKTSKHRMSTVGCSLVSPQLLVRLVVARLCICNKHRRTGRGQNSTNGIAKYMAQHDR
jgi:hypothetical protein